MSIYILCIWYIIMHDITVLNWFSWFSVPTFITLIREVESPYEVKDLIHQFLGESNAAKEFGELFLQRRNLKKNNSRSGAGGGGNMKTDSNSQVI